MRRVQNVHQSRTWRLWLHTCGKKMHRFGHRESCVVTVVVVVVVVARRGSVTVVVVTVLVPTNGGHSSSWHGIVLNARISSRVRQ